ncbi:MAG: twitching motility protein PilT [Lysobacterales bacterium]|jgi:twitching motility protein PilT
MEINDILIKSVSQDASDIHFTVGRPPSIRHVGDLKPLDGFSELNCDDTQALAFSMISDEQKKEFLDTRELDFSYAIEGCARFRVNLYWQKDLVGIAVRVIPYTIPDAEDIGLSDAIKNLTKLKNGLVLVTGPTGSGKSTTLAALVNKINKEDPKHILTIEDPVEFVYNHEKAMINQREIGNDTPSFASALKHALREDPDVILVGEMRDLETIAATLEIAETGHLAFATLHTMDVAQTIDRIVDVFPPHQQSQIRMTLSVVIKGIICQKLLPNVDGTGRVAAREILISDFAVANMIREGQTPQIYSKIQTGGALGMCTMDRSIDDLLAAGLITNETAQLHKTSTI